jgi:hypothetical protein
MTTIETDALGWIRKRLTFWKRRRREAGCKLTLMMAGGVAAQ